MNLPARKRNRLPEYDYSAPNAYFITICTNHRQKLFWNNANTVVGNIKQISLNGLGIIVRQCIEDIPKFYPAVSVDHYVIMPNHVHLLLQIHPDSDGQPVSTASISTVVRMMKGAVSRQAGFPVWQKGYYDHVIRNDKDYQETWQYIEGNPGKWMEDELYFSF